MNKQYIITEAQNKEVIDHLECGFDDDSNAMTVLMLLSLPELAAEPLAWAMRNSDGSITEINCQYVEGIFNIPLSISQQPMKPITSEDVTDEMQVEISKQRELFLSKKCFSAIINTWIKHRGEKT